MQLPIRVRVGKLEFVFWETVAALLGLALAFGPSVGLWFFLAPSGFLQRLVTLGCCGILFVPMAIGGFFLFATISEKTTGY